MTKQNNAPTYRVHVQVLTTFPWLCTRSQLLSASNTMQWSPNMILTVKDLPMEDTATPYLLTFPVWKIYFHCCFFCFSGNVTSSNATTVLNCTNTTNLKIGLNLLTEDALDQTLHIKATNQWNIALNLLLLWYRWAEACNYFVKSPHDDEWGQCKWHYCIQHLKRITQIVAFNTGFWMRPYWHPNSTFSLVVLMRSQSTANENQFQLR